MNKPTKYYSNIQEKAVAKALGGRQVRGSGASPFSLGDVRLEKVLVECKTSTVQKSSYSVKKSVLDKIRKEAIEMGKYYSMLAFNFGPESKNYYVIDEDTAKFLVEMIDKIYNTN